MSAPASSYVSEIRRAMKMLADDPRTVFVGQGVRYNCHRMWETLADVPMEKRIEFPVAEEFQMGFCTGLALTGKIPVCIFPRMDFMLLAMNQLINHLDKAHLFGWSPKVIIRTAVGSKSPLDPGPQHSQDHAGAFDMMLKHVEVTRLGKNPFSHYELAMKHSRPALLVEEMSCY